MFKLLAFFALMATVYCAPAPTPKPGLALAYDTAALPLAYETAALPLAYEYRYPAQALSYAKSYTYNNHLAYAYAYPQNYYYNAPLSYTL